MANVLVFGHQNPDNDAIMSAVVLSQLLNQVEYAGNTYEACALGQLPAESAKLLADAGIVEPRVIESVEAGQLVVLTDHNESAQSVAGLKDATVFGVVDHHRIGDFETAGPLHYICLPWGSSCTIVTKLAGVLGVELSDVQAKLLLSAMMTDTLMLKSPTTTDVDRAVAAKLGEQVGVDPVKFGMEVFLTRPSGSFTAAEMVGNDIKMFEPAGKKLLIGQYETVDKSRALGMIDEIREAMRAYAAEKGADGIVLCITDIMESPTTTDVDRAVAAKLGEQVGVDPVKFGMEVFLTRPSGSFTAAEMVGNDIKMFEPAGKKLLIGQYETVDKSRALGMIDEIREAMRAYAAEKGADGIVLCITDIMEEGSQVLLEGETEAAQKGLGIADEHDGVWMPGVLSRKKQVAAPIMAAC